MTYQSRRIDGRIILNAEDLIGHFKLNYNRAVSEWEATGRRIPARAVINQSDTDEEFEYFLGREIKF